MSEPLVRLRREGEVAIAELANPPANALGARFIDDLGAAVAVVATSDAAALVITSAVPGFFGAGADLKHLSTVRPEGFRDYLQPLRDVLTSLQALEAVTIAAIDGLALGGGFELALNCDLRFLGPEAAVGLPEIRLGLLPGATGTQRLTHLVGRARAEEMMLTGRTVRAEEAIMYAIGFPASTTAAAEAVAWALRNLGGDNLAAAAIRRCLDAAGAPDVDGLAVEFDEVDALFASHVAQHRITTFIERHL